VDLFDFSHADFIEGIEYGGASTFLGFAGGADVTLFI
jgi:peroxiredoxin family protein